VIALLLLVLGREIDSEELRAIGLGVVEENIYSMRDLGVEVYAYCEGGVLLLVPASCLDEYVIHVDCIRDFIEERKAKLIKAFRQILKSVKPISAMLTPIPVGVRGVLRSSGALVNLLYPVNFAKWVTAVYLRNRASLHQSGPGRLIAEMCIAHRKVGWDSTLQPELYYTVYGLGLDDVETLMRELGAAVYRGTVTTGDLLAIFR